MVLPIDQVKIGPTVGLEHRRCELAPVLAGNLRITLTEEARERVHSLIHAEQVVGVVPVHQLRSFEL